MPFPDDSWVSESPNIKALESDAGDIGLQTRKVADLMALMSVTLEHCPCGVVISDNDGEFLLANKKAEELFGQKIATIPKEQWPEFFTARSPDDRSTTLPFEDLPLCKSLNGEHVDSQRIWVDRTSKMVQVQSAPVYVSGRMVGAFTVLYEEKQDG